MRALLLLVVLSLAVGCAKRGAKNTAPNDETAGVKLQPSPGGKDAKGGKADEPNWLTDPRFKTDPPAGQPLPDAPSPGKQPWGIPPPQGGWQGPNAGAQPVQPAAPGAPPPAPGAPIPPGMGVFQPQPAPVATPAAKRVEMADMKEVWIFIENASGASGKMPSQLLTYQALIAAKSPAADLVKDGTIFLTGATVRESVWAYETQALTSGGLVATQNGVETLTAAELKTRLGK